MEPPRRCQRITTAVAICLVSVLMSTAWADSFKPGEWDGEWVSQVADSSGAIRSQLYPAGSAVTGQMQLTNSPCADETSVTGSLQQGVLDLNVSCSGCSITFTAIDLQDSTISGQYDIYCNGRFYDQGAFLLNYSEQWPNASDCGGDWLYLKWFGYFNVSEAPWIYHLTLGWLYPYGTSPDGIWFFDPQMNAFWWTSQEVYPYLYRTGSNSTWLFYDEGTSNPRWFYNLSTQKWEKD